MSALTSLNATLSTSVNTVQAQIKDVQTQLATGTKTLDAGQVGTVTRLSSQVTGYNAAAANISQAQSAISVAQTGLSSINDLINQMIDLTNKAANTAVSAGDLAKLDITFQSLLTQINSISDSTSLNGVNLISANATDAIYETGIASTDKMTVTAVSSDTGSLGIASLALSTTAAATAALTTLASALDTLSTNQSSLSADAVGFTAKGKTDAAIATQLQHSIDTISKPDQAKLQMDLQAMNNQQSVDYYLISQLNTEASAAMTIFR